jgi:hypothetical protein
MKAIDRRKGDMLTRVCQYEEDHPVTPAIPRATALFTEANTLKIALQTHAGTQVAGRGGYRGGATERAVLAKEIRTVLVDMAATARGLEREHPGMTDQFRLGRPASSNAQLVATAHAFLTAATPAEVKQLFTDRAFPVDFDAQLTAKIAALETALGRKATGLQTQRYGSAGLDVLSRRITDVMRELRALMVKHLRDNNPTLLAVWNDAARSYAQPVPAEAAPAPTPEGSGSGI